MNIRRIFSFLRTPVGRLVVFLLLFFVLVSGGIFQKKQRNIPEIADRDTTLVTHATHSRFVHEIPPPPPKVTRLPPPTPMLISSEEPEEPLESYKPIYPTPSVQPTSMPSPPPIEMAIYNASDAVPTAMVQYLPFGRLIRCELVNTVDTSNILTPIIGLVTDDVWHDGKLIIPAGTEVHGVAANQPERERVGSGVRWILVFHDGRELSVSGIALDHAPIPGKEEWQISDGSAGLRGSIIQADRYAEIKAVAATMLAAAADGFSETTHYVTQFGGVITQKVPGWRSALTAGLERGAQLISERLLQKLGADPFFVRVPAGTTFYLYVTQTVDLQKATIAGSNSRSLQPPQEQLHQPQDPKS